MMILWIAVIVLALCLFLKYLCTPCKGFPPGPRGIPLLGALLEIQNEHPTLFHIAFQKLSQRYGPVCGLYMGLQPTVIVNGLKAVKEVLSREDFSDRVFPKIFSHRSWGKKLGILFNDGPLWREQRRFTLRHLRDFGFGKRSMEGLILEEVNDLIASLDRQLPAPTGIAINDIFGVPVINVLWAIMAGERYKSDDPYFQKVVECVNQLFSTGNPIGGPLIALPFLRFVPPFRTQYQQQVHDTNEVHKFVMDTVSTHRSTFDPSHMRDFIDVYLKEMDGKEHGTSFTDEQLYIICFDLFMAGTETTSNSLAFAILLMILYPTVQENVHNELDAVIGKDRFPTTEDIHRLPYTEATLMEVQRMSSIAPFTVPHMNRNPTKLFEYTIPKDTLVLVNLWSVHMDQQHWGDPENFRPERFLSDEGTVKKDDWLIPFGLGPRMCLGEPLAKMTSSLFFAGLLQRFRFDAVDGKTPDPEPKLGFSLAPKPFSAVLTRRA